MNATLLPSSIQQMHCPRPRGRLAPSLFPHSYPPSSISSRFRTRSTSAPKNVTKASTKAWHDTARSLLRAATSRRAGLVSAKTRRATELKLVNSILEEQCLSGATQQGFQDAVRPMMTHLEESASELPPGVGPGALVEIRW
jgi:hypothetical protein